MTTTTHHYFGHCEVRSVHCKQAGYRQVEILLEKWQPIGLHGDEITLHIDGDNAQQLCLGLLNIIGNNPDFHDELTRTMKIQRTPE